MDSAAYVMKRKFLHSNSVIDSAVSTKKTILTILTLTQHLKRVHYIRFETYRHKSSSIALFCKFKCGNLCNVIASTKHPD